MELPSMSRSGFTSIFFFMMKYNQMEGKLAGVCVCVTEREKERECGIGRERERRVCLCMCVLYVSSFELLSETEGVLERERECVFVSVYVCM